MSLLASAGVTGSLAPRPPSLVKAAFFGGQEDGPVQRPIELEIVKRTAVALNEALLVQEARYKIE